MHKQMEQWYVLHTKSSAEKQVASALDQRDVQTFLPLISVAPHKPPEGQKEQQREPLFPGYLFARFDLTTGSPADWKWIPGLRYLVRFGEVAIPVPDEVMSLLERKIPEMQAARSNPASAFKPGDVLRIKDGPFAGMQAVFDKNYVSGERVQILLDALNGSYKLKIEAASLEKAADTDRNRNKRPRRTRGRGRYIKRLAD